MDVSSTLAGYGALLSTILAVPTVHRWWQDRPRIEVTLSHEGEYIKSPGYEHLVEFPDDLVGVELISRLIVDVRNVGRMNGVVREVGLTLSVGPNGDFLSYLPLTSGDDVHVIPPLSVKRFDRPQFDVVATEHIDKPVRAYARDPGGRVHWSAPVPLYRQLIDSGWRPDPPIAPELCFQTDTRYQPYFPERRWKVWKARHLRPPTRRRQPR